MSLSPESTISELRQEFTRRGIDFTTFARDHGWKPETVRQVAYRYWGRPEEPQGRLTYEILTKLREFVASQN